MYIFPTGNLITKRYFRTSEWGFLRDTCHVTWSSLFYLKLLRAQVGIWRHSYNRFIQLLLHNYTQHTRTVSRRWMWTFLMRNNTIKQLFSELNKKNWRKVELDMRACRIKLYCWGWQEWSKWVSLVNVLL